MCLSEPQVHCESEKTLRYNTFTLGIHLSIQQFSFLSCLVCPQLSKVQYVRFFCLKHSIRHNSFDITSKTSMICVAEITIEVNMLTS